MDRLTQAIPKGQHAMRRLSFPCITASAIAALFVVAQTASAAPHNVQRACDSEPARWYARCFSQINRDIPPQSARPGQPGIYPTGINTLDLQQAYSFVATVPAGIPNGPLVAIVDAGDSPNVESDLATYRATYGLGACTTANGCFQKVNQYGDTSPLPAPAAGWDLEIALDVQMVSATCPNCRIVLLEGNGASFDDLGTAVNTAATRFHASAISNSYGAPEWDGTQFYSDWYSNHPGSAVVVSSGDSGYGVSFPASSQYVTAVGGTTLTRNHSQWSETAWSGSGSGCSVYIPKPTWQKDTLCPRRTVTDVGMIADPSTGVATYDSIYGGWLVVGGTSVGSPIVAGLYALAGNASTVFAGSQSYSQTRSLNDIRSGSNGTCGGTYLCAAIRGYDGPTGNGTPKGLGAF
jgi:hypothetical protein